MQAAQHRRRPRRRRLRPTAAGRAAISRPTARCVVVYEPQVASWENQKLLTLHAAVAHTAEGQRQGAARHDHGRGGHARVGVGTAGGFLQLPNPPVELSVGAERAGRRHRRRRSRRACRAPSASSRSIACSPPSTRASFVRRTSRASRPIRRSMFFSTRPAVVVNLDGDPIWSPIAEQRSSLRGEHELGFVRAPAVEDVLPPPRESVAEGEPACQGRGRRPATLPASFAQAAGRRQLEGRARGAAGRDGRRRPPCPTVFVSTAPAELILLRGAPQYEPVPGTKLLWVRNTESDVFRLGQTGPVYYLVAGRWFSAPDFTGPWTFATLDAPRRLREDSARARALTRAGVGARHRAGGRSGAARAGAADGAREQEGGARRRT